MLVVNKTWAAARIHWKDTTLFFKFLGSNVDMLNWLRSLEVLVRNMSATPGARFTYRGLIYSRQTSELYDRLLIATTKGPIVIADYQTFYDSLNGAIELVATADEITEYFRRQ